MAAVGPDFSPLPCGPAGDEWKMSVSGLKAELKFLESIFDPNHERFRIIDWKPDELSCQFNVTGEKLLIIHCNITVRRVGGSIFYIMCRLAVSKIHLPKMPS